MKNTDIPITANILAINEPYDYNDLIRSYIYTKQRYVHDDFSNYYEQLFKTLCKLFDITEVKKIKIKSRDDIRKTSLLGLLKNTIHSYLMLQTPTSQYLEAGLLFSNIRKSERGDSIMNNLKNINNSCSNTKKEHEELISNLFRELHGESAETFSKEDLLNLGFNASTQPKINDYYDYF